MIPEGFISELRQRFLEDLALAMEDDLDTRASLAGLINFFVGLMIANNQGHAAILLSELAVEVRNAER